MKSASKNTELKQVKGLSDAKIAKIRDSVEYRERIAALGAYLEIRNELNYSIAQLKGKLDKMIGLAPVRSAGQDRLCSHGLKILPASSWEDLKLYSASEYCMTCPRAV